MAKDADLFFHTVDDDGDGNGEVESEGEIDGAYDEDGEEDEFRETLDAASPVFWSFSDVAASDDGEDGAGYIGSVEGDLLETRESPDFELFEDADETGSDYFGLDVERDALDDVGANGLLGSPVGEGLRIEGFDSDSDLEDEGTDVHDIDSSVGDEGDDLGASLRWDSLRIEGQDRREEEVAEEEFDWEELDGRFDLMGADEEDEYAGSGHTEELNDSEIDEDDVSFGGRPLRTWDPEILLAMRRVDDSDAGGDGGNALLTDTEDVEAAYMDEDPGNTSDYEVLFGQFLEHVSPINGSLPAARSVLESLTSVTITEEDVANNNTLCAVCKDEMYLEQKVKRLPCFHHYHGDCILPWLRLRNTCPICRYGLPTDNPVYENWRARRTDSATGTSMD